MLSRCAGEKEGSSKERAPCLLGKRVGMGKKGPHEPGGGKTFNHYR